jgi:hypothetical protein
MGSSSRDARRKPLQEAYRLAQADSGNRIPEDPIPSPSVGAEPGEQPETIIIPSEAIAPPPLLTMIKTWTIKPWLWIGKRKWEYFLSLGAYPMKQWGEYWAAVVLAFIAGIGLISKLSQWNTARPMIGRTLRIFGYIGICGLLGLFTVIINKARGDEPWSRLLPSKPVSLDVRASSSWINKKDAVVGGIKWIEGFYDVRLVIDDRADEFIQNLEMTVRVLPNSKDLLAGMGQISNIQGCEFHAPELTDDVVARFPGLTISAKDMIATEGGMPWGEYWKMFCSRLHSGVELRVVIGAINMIDKSAPKKLKISGTYDVSATGATKVIRFEKTIEVTH